MEKVIILIIISLGWLAWQSGVLAQTNQSSLGVSPAIIEGVLTPGQTQQTKIYVFNVTNFPVPVKANIGNLVVTQKIDTQDKSIFDISSWIKVEPSDFILQPKEKKEIVISVKTPAKAEPGGHYATIYFQPLFPQEALTQDTTYLAAKVGVLGFYIVKGQITEAASITSLTIPSFQSFGPVPISLNVKNSGNVHILPAGKVTIRDVFGRVVTEVPIKPLTVLPQTERELTSSWEQKLILGKFTAQANLVYGSNLENISSPVVNFWVVPVLPIFIILVLLISLIIFFIVIWKRFLLSIKILFSKEEVIVLKKLKVNKNPKRGGEKI
ncbi:DUF916 domain-containing protein [Patescibacteria group bacterium]|nr:DUF916 domain-containing protein [Patescibacteria group bacterium]